MISCGFVGLTIHIAFITVTTHHYLTDINVDSRSKGLGVYYWLYPTVMFQHVCLFAEGRSSNEYHFPIWHYASNFLCYFVILQRTNSYSQDVTFANGFGYEEVDGSTQYIHCNEAEDATGDAIAD
eukprot:80081_1